MIDRTSNTIGFFVMYPEPGKVKTRLAAGTDPVTAARFYRCFAEDMLDTLINVKAGLKIFCDPAEDVSKYAEWLGPDCDYLRQEGGDLGQRMKNAFETMFASGAKRAVVVGSDLPDLPERVVNDAFDFLDSDDVVLGPALDGGYYLIGFTAESFLPVVFANIEWSTGEVFSNTVNILQKNNVTIHLLNQWYDIDDMSGVERFLKPYNSARSAGSKTYALLKEMKMNVRSNS